jgi:carbamoyl-phosphate synthase large subunit
MNKQKTVAWLNANGFAAPRCRVLVDETEIEQIDFYPVVVKPISGGSGSRNTFIAQSKVELLHLSRYLAATGESFLVQEYVGTPDAEYTVGVLHDLDGRYVDSIALRRHLSGALHVRASVPNLTGRAELGRTLVISSGVSHGEIGRFPEVTEPCRLISEALGARGPINIQCRLVNGVVYPFEINPRFSGTTGLRALVGYNEPQQLIDIHIKGREAAPTPYQSATIIRSLVEHVLDGKLAASWSELPY